MHSGDLNFFRQWFADFCGSYRSPENNEQMNIALKETHSLHVAENARLIAQGEAFGENAILLAETAGLLHDIGRFPQYAEYKTFRDGISVNHGLLGAETLKSTAVLERLEGEDRDAVLWAVRYHNSFSVPPSGDPRHTLFLRITRDADKLDIWRVFCEYYEAPDDKKADAVPLGLPDIAGYSDGAVESIMKKEVVKLANVKSLNDMKLLQLSWVFDINFRASLGMAGDRGIINRLAATLPDAAEIHSAVSVVRNYIAERAVCV